MCFFLWFCHDFGVKSVVALGYMWLSESGRGGLWFRRFIILNFTKKSVERLGIVLSRGLLAVVGYSIHGGIGQGRRAS